MIWTLATMLKYSCSAFFSNYVQHFTNICDSLFLWFERLRIQKQLYRAPVPWNNTSKQKHKIKKTMIWTLATMLKYPCSAFFSNYIQHFTDICDSLFLWFERQRIRKELYRAPVPWNRTSKYKHKIKKNYDLNPCNYS